jgi:hypothetical protein
MAGAGDERQDTLDEFHELVNLTPKLLREWLATDASQQVGDRDEGESTGHASGRRIVEILEKRKAEYSDDDVAHMRKVNGYIKRHLAQRPRGDVKDSRWRYSLMNWGHDPLR